MASWIPPRLEVRGNRNEWNGRAFGTRSSPLFPVKAAAFRYSAATAYAASSCRHRARYRRHWFPRLAGYEQGLLPRRGYPAAVRRVPAASLTAIVMCRAIFIFIGLYNPRQPQRHPCRPKARENTPDSSAGMIGVSATVRFVRDPGMKDARCRASVPNQTSFLRRWRCRCRWRRARLHWAGGLTTTGFQFMPSEVEIRGNLPSTESLRRFRGCCPRRQSNRKTLWDFCW